MLLKDAPFATILKFTPENPKNPPTLVIKESIGNKIVLIDIADRTREQISGNFWTVSGDNEFWECEVFTGNLQIIDGFGNFEK